ncbi:MAG: ACP S-malonyltransferase [Christensenellales bacterium]
MKLGILFAGQGAQKPTMGKSLFDQVAESKKIFNRADDVCPDITYKCFEMEQTLLNQTVNAQPAIFTVDMAAYQAFLTLGYPVHGAAGFSLGEYAALTAAGVLDFETSLKLVCRRAELMQRQGELTPGGMRAVLGPTADEVEAMILEVNSPTLQAVNYNCPGQTVVAGDMGSLDRLSEICAQKKVRAVPLPVSGAFHSVFMQPVAKALEEAFDGLTFHKPQFPLYSNVISYPYGDDIPKLLALQTAKPVRWEQTIRNMMADGCDVFLELGQGTTLSGFLRRIDKDVPCFAISDYESYLTVKEELQKLS